MQPNTSTPTIFWNVDANGKWNTAADWSTGKLPGAMDAVWINTTDRHTVTFGTGSATVQSLTVGNDDFIVSGGTLAIEQAASFANELTVTGGTLNVGNGGATINTLTQSGGSLTGASVVTVSGDASFTGTDGQSGKGTTVLKGTADVNAVLTLTGGRTLENKGTIDWTGGFWQPNGGNLKNDAGATINIKGGKGINDAHGANTFFNAGAIVADDGPVPADPDGTGETYIYVPLINKGTIAVKSGQLNIGGGGSSSASAFSVAASAELTFFTGYPYNGQSVNPIFTMTGGTFNVAGKTAILGGIVDFSAAKVMSFGESLYVGGAFGGTLKLGANNATVTELTEQGSSIGSGTIDGTGIVTVTGPAKYAGGTETGTGTTVLQGSSVVSYIMYLSGGRTVENKGALVMNTDTDVYLSGGTLKNDIGATLTVGMQSGMQAEKGDNSLVNAGTLKLESGAGLSLNFSVINTGLLSLGSGGFNAGGTDNQFSGKVTGTGTLSLGIPRGATESAPVTTISDLAIAGGASLLNYATANQTGNVSIISGQITNYGTWNIADSAKLTNGLSRTGQQKFMNAGLLAKTTGTGTAVIGTNTVDSGQIAIASGALEFTGAANSFSGSISGAGRLELSGGTNAIASKAYITTSAWIIADSAQASLAGTINYAGKFSLWKNATMDVGANILNLSGKGNSLAGAIVGTGTFIISSGSGTLVEGATINVAAFALAGGTTTIAADLNYAGQFELDGSATMAIQLDKSLELTGKNAALDGTLRGQGSLTIAGSATVYAISTLKIEGGVTIQNAGTVSQAGNATMDDAKIVNRAGSTWTIADKASLLDVGGKNLINNLGSIAKSNGDGTSMIAVAITNDKIISVSSGTLTLTGSVFGEGTLAIEGTGTLALANSVGKNQTVSFTGKGETLALRHAKAFAAQIEGFGAGDRIDLTQFKFGAGETVSFQENGSKTAGILTVTDGSLVAKIALFGQYSASFHVARDAASGSVITYGPSTATDSMIAQSPH